jgi:hypothetical protein
MGAFRPPGFRVKECAAQCIDGHAVVMITNDADGTRAGTGRSSMTTDRMDRVDGRGRSTSMLVLCEWIVSPKQL